MEVHDAQGSDTHALMAVTPEAPAAPGGPAVHAGTAGSAGSVRWRMLLLLVLVMFVNYMDRGNLAIVAPVLQRTMNLSPASLGLLFSAFAWTYLLSIPLAGILLDRFGPRIMFTVALSGWSTCTMLTGTVDSFAAVLACRMGVGIFESPAIPTNMRCVSAWFPKGERGVAIGWYTATQSIAVGATAPVLTLILLNGGWRPVFYATGVVGLLAAIVWQRFYRDPRSSTAVSPAELTLIREGGGLVDLGAGAGAGASADAGASAGAGAERSPLSWRHLAQLFRERQLVGMFIGQYAVMTTLYFFLTWFPSYLIKAKGLTILQSGQYAVLPFLMAVLGALCGGRWSDWMIARGFSLSLARKGPVILGLVLASAMVGANYTSDIRLVIGLLGLAFFGQSMASAVTGALFTDVAPKNAIGLAGGMLTFFANLGSALSPLIVGLIVERSGEFQWGLVYVSAVSLVGACAYLFIIGKVRRVVLAA